MIFSNLNLLENQKKIRFFMVCNSKKLRKVYFIVIPFLIILLGFLPTFYLKTNAKGNIIEETTVPILTYHKFCIGDSPDEYTININLFKQQLEYLKENKYQVISVSQLLKCIKNNNFPEKPIVITIDDGFKSVYTLAYPLLKEYQFPATLFLYTNFIGNSANQLSWEEIKEMTDHGMEIGSHTVSHCNLLHLIKNESQIDYLKRIDKELYLSKKILEENTASPIVAFAYPYGIYSQEIKMLAKQAGYQALLNVNGMNNSIPTIDSYSLNRQIVPPGFSMKQFDRLLHEKTININSIYPADGTVTNNQELKIGAILDDSCILPDTLIFRLSGSGPLSYAYVNELKEISFTPVAPKLLQKRTWIAQIVALDRESGYKRKISWLFTVK